MPAALEYYTDAQEISFTKDNTFKLVSLAGIVSSDAVGVILWATNGLPHGAENGRVFAAKGTSYTIDFDSLVAGESCAQAVCKLNASKQLYLRAEDSNVTVYATGAFRGPGAVLYDDPIDQSPTTEAQLGAWYNRFIEGSNGRDDAAVILVAQNDTANTATFGIRDWGSTTATTFSGDQWERSKWAVCKVTRGPFFLKFYQLYTTGKYLEGPPETVDPYTAFYEVGYVLEGHGLKGIRDITDEGVTPGASWQTASITAVPSGAEGFVAMMRATAFGPYHGLRAVGSTNGFCPREGFTSFFHGCGITELVSGQYEYYLGGNTGLWAYAYTMPLAILDLASGELALDSDGDLIVRAPMDTADAGLVIAASGDAQARAYVSGSGELVLDAVGEVVPRAYVSGLGEIVLDAAGEVVPRAYVSGLGEIVLDAAGDAQARAYLSGLGELALDAGGDAQVRAYLSGLGELVLDAAGDAQARAYLSGLGELALDAAGEVVPRAYLDAADAGLVITAAGDVAAGVRLEPTGAGVVITASGDIITRVLVTGLAELVLDASGQILVSGIPVSPCVWIYPEPERPFTTPEAADGFASPAAGGWRAAEGAQEFAVQADGGWFDEEGAQEFVSGEDGGWFDEEGAQEITSGADGDWQTRKPCG